MHAFFWFIAIFAALLLYLAIWGVISSYVAGLRGRDKLEGFKTGLLLGPIGAALVLFGKEPVPDIEVVCPHCGTRQDVDATLKWYECWQCEKRSDVPPSPAGSPNH